MTTRRMGHGLAISPSKDLELFRSMARRGKRLTGFDAIGNWRFEDAAPEDADFAHTMEPQPPAAYYDMFDAAGWETVIARPGMQIFKAPPGTPPIYSDPSSAHDALRRSAVRFARHTLATLLAFLLITLLVGSTNFPAPIDVLLLVAALVPLVYTAVPLAGVLRQLRAARRPGTT